MLIHGSCASRNGAGVLILGPPGSGKSDLVLRLLGRGWALVADDQVALSGVVPAAPPALRGMLEVRGLGIHEGLAVAEDVRLALVVDLVARDGVVRLPIPAVWQAEGVSLPRLSLCAFDASACDKLELALETVLGRARQRAGAFAA